MQRVWVTILCQIPCNHIYNLSKKENDVFYLQECYHIDKNIKRVEGRLGTNYIQ